MEVLGLGCETVSDASSPNDDARGSTSISAGFGKNEEVTRGRAASGVRDNPEPTHEEGSFEIVEFALGNEQASRVALEECVAIERMPVCAQLLPLGQHEVIVSDAFRSPSFHDLKRIAVG